MRKVLPSNENMKKITTLLLLTFFLQDISAAPLYFKCEGKEITVGIQKENFKSGEHIESLIVNKESKKVLWGGSELKYVPDGNEDGIYEFYSEDYIYDLDFNAITLVLEETKKTLSGSRLEIKYLCEKTTPSL